MAATPIATTTKYINAGVTKVLFLASAANPASPTRLEINAGTDLTSQIAATKGWMVESDQIDTPNLDDPFTPTLSGRTKVADSSLTFYCDASGADARAMFPRGVNGYIIWLDGGDVVGRKMSVFPVRVSSQGFARTIEGKEAAQVEISYAVTASPTENVTIP